METNDRTGQAPGEDAVGAQFAVACEQLLEVGLAMASRPWLDEFAFAMAPICAYHSYCDAIAAEVQAGSLSVENFKSWEPPCRSD